MLELWRAEVLELWGRGVGVVGQRCWSCIIKGLGRESVVRRDVRKGVKSEVGGIEGWRN